MALTKTSNQVIQSPYKRNVIINGDMRIWQRGTTPVLGAAYYVDRFLLYTAGAAPAVITVGGGAGGSYQSISIIGAAGNTTTELLQRIEKVNCAHFASQVATLSAWVYSAESRAIGLYARYANVADNFSALTSIGSTTSSAETGWRKISYTFTVPNVQNGIEIGVTFGAVLGSQNVATTCIQLELGSVDTPFEFRPFSEELMLCQRYYEKSYDINVAPGTINAYGQGQWLSNYTGSGVYFDSTDYQVSKRVNTSGRITFYSPATGAINRVRNASGGSDVTVNGNVNGSQRGFCGPIPTTELMLNGYSYSWQWTADAEL